MSKFKVGDRVAVYVGGASDVDPTRLTGVVSFICPGGDLFVKFASSGAEWVCHPKQCRHLKKKARKEKKEVPVPLDGSGTFAVSPLVFSLIDRVNFLLDCERERRGKK